jgi:hypothetical protein
MTSDQSERLRNPAIDEAAACLMVTPRETIKGHVVKSVQERFGLSVFEAVAACVSAERMRRN